jgi:hypothetical protein
MFWRLRTLLLATTALAPLAAAPAGANPLGAQVVGGSASVQGQGTATVTVTQQSNSAIINWNTFNIGAGETTKIIQPSSSSVELDRVTGGLAFSSGRAERSTLLRFLRPRTIFRTAISWPAATTSPASATLPHL